MDFLNFLLYTDIELRNYQLLCEYKIKGFIFKELGYFNKIPKSLQNKSFYLEEIEEKYLELFEPKFIDSEYKYVEQHIFGKFSAEHYNKKFIMMLDFYLDNPSFNLIEFQTKILIQAMKYYESNKINH